jgi:arylsulfatase A-like enzyme
MPTVLDLLGVARPQGLDGADLRRLWQGGGEDLDGRRLFAETGPRFRRDTAQSVRTGRHKLLRDRDDVELFDVVDDPLETRNLIEERPEVARVLTEALDRLRARRSQGGASVEIAPEEEERLRALGYL